nr:sensor histidine kinase [Gammaproteobacteria bacterium]NIT53956.1 sensor histidine kinase [candidate division Zixibacteria bacterium]NIW44411.1 sensor histidine kinase [Gammaproteobacteria bacterium]
FRLVQESLNNVAKHASATEITITMTADNRDEITLIVSDNGGGFDMATTNGNGFGLEQMGARVANIGGEFNISSELERGTTVTAVLPTKENTP